VYVCVTYSSHQLRVERVENIEVDVFEVNVWRQVGERDGDDETIGHARCDACLVRLHIQHTLTLQTALNE